MHPLRTCTSIRLLWLCALVAATFALQQKTLISPSRGMVMSAAHGVQEVSKVVSPRERNLLKRRLDDKDVATTMDAAESVEIEASETATETADAVEAVAEDSELADAELADNEDVDLADAEKSDVMDESQEQEVEVESADNSVEQEIASEPQVELFADAMLSFFLLGDWGKGGTTGTYGSVVRSTDNYDEADIENLAADVQPYASDISWSSVLTQWMPQFLYDLYVLLGGNKKYYQTAIAKQMALYAESAEAIPSFVVALGDNFYSNGVSSSTDNLWNYVWKDVYLTDYPSLRVPWYPVFGNHDYGGGSNYVQAQLNRYMDHTDDDLWMFREKNYTEIYQIPNGGGTNVAVIYVDTTTLAPSINKCCNENGGVSKDKQASLVVDQLANLDRMLNETVSAPIPPSWLLVAGHYPIYSVGSNGDTSELQTYLLPLLKKYNVHAYLCGHDHLSAHLQSEGINFFVAGAGSMTDNLKYNTKAESTIWTGAGYSAFGVATATPYTLSIKYIDTDGAVRYEYQLNNPHVNPAAINTKGGSAFNTPENGIIISQDPQIGTGDNYYEQLMQEAVYATGGVAMVGFLSTLAYCMLSRRTERRAAKAKLAFLSEADIIGALHGSGVTRAAHGSATKGKYVELMEMGYSGESPRNGAIPHDEEGQEDRNQHAAEHEDLHTPVVVPTMVTTHSSQNSTKTLPQSTINSSSNSPQLPPNNTLLQQQHQVQQLQLQLQQQQQLQYQLQQQQAVPGLITQQALSSLGPSASMDAKYALFNSLPPVRQQSQYNLFKSTQDGAVHRRSQTDTL